MRTFDLSPLYRSTVGFDRLAQMLGEASTVESPTYPPYNIERLGDNEYRITMAVAGFGQDDVSIEVKQNALTVSAGKAENGNGDRQFLHQGIASRSFERKFQLADHVAHGRVSPRALGRHREGLHTGNHLEGLRGNRLIMLDESSII